MLRQMGVDLVVEQAVAVVGDEAVDVILIGGGDAERRLKMLAGENEPLAAVVRRADDDDSEAGVRS